MTADGTAPHPSEDIAREIASKIADGRLVTTSDLETLSTVAFGSRSQLSSIPLFDRQFLQRHVERVGNVQFVRYIGMVQDMLDSEYYLTVVHGKSTHYCDVVSEDKDEEAITNQSVHLAERLAERTPLVVVPIPFASDWFVEKLYDQQQHDKSEMDCQGSGEGDGLPDRPAKKRNRDVDASLQPSFKPRFAENQDPNQMKVSKSTEVEMNAPYSLDWWPAGCMGSHVEHCPVLAKMYYERDSPKNPQRRLRLNDLVELVGVISVDPLQADFFTQQQQQTPQCQLSSVDKDCLFLGNDDMFLEGDRQILPPPSQLPRLHVLCHKLLDLDQLCRRVVGSNSIEQDEQPSITLSHPVDLRQQAISILSEAMGHQDMVSEATIMALMSMAQRSLSPSAGGEELPPSWEVVSTPTEDLTLGCASLHIQLPTELASNAFYRHLQALLQDVCPIVGTMDLTRNGLNSSLWTAPRKDTNGHLVPSVMQLPKGSTVLIHLGNMTEGSLSMAGQETLAALRSMVASHKVPYSFDAMMKYHFEADYRIIVVSTSFKSSDTARASTQPSRSKLLSCSLQISISLEPTTTLAPMCQWKSHMLRQYFASCRHDGSNCNGNTNIVLSKRMLEKAQKDFVQRRLAARQTPVGSNEPSQQQHIGEEEFHRWLTLTRLQARSCLGKRVATMEDWERALELDDAMVKPRGG